MKVAPSVLSADFANLQREAESVCNADYIHFDVMDGHFVPNISIGIPVLASLKKAVPNMKYDVHLMIENPEKYIQQFVKAGADIITVHIEATEDIEVCLKTIKDHGAVPAVSVKPNTPIETVFPYLDKIGMVLIMTVEPGFGGQKMILTCLEKAIKLKKEITRLGLNVMIEADGGINEENLILLKNSGVDMVVVGSALFAKKDRQAAIEFLKK